MSKLSPNLTISLLDGESLYSVFIDFIRPLTDHDVKILSDCGLSSFKGSSIITANVNVETLLKLCKFDFVSYIEKSQNLGK